MGDPGSDPEGVARQGQALFADRVDLDALRRVDVPVLIVHGAADRLIDHRASRQLHETMPTSDLWLVDGLGHDLPLELLSALTARAISNADRPRSDARHEGLAWRSGSTCHIRFTIEQKSTFAHARPRRCLGPCTPTKVRLLYLPLNHLTAPPTAPGPGGHAASTSAGPTRRQSRDRLAAPPGQGRHQLFDRR
jgi:hypothetical protein